MTVSTSILVHLSQKVEIVRVTAGTVSWTAFLFYVYGEDNNPVAEVTVFDSGKNCPVPIINLTREATKESA